MIKSLLRDRRWITEKTISTISRILKGSNPNVLIINELFTETPGSQRNNLYLQKLRNSIKENNETKIIRIISKSESQPNAAGVVEYADCISAEG